MMKEQFRIIGQRRNGPKGLWTYEQDLGAGDVEECMEKARDWLRTRSEGAAYHRVSFWVRDALGNAVQFGQLKGRWV